MTHETESVTIGEAEGTDRRNGSDCRRQEVDRDEVGNVRTPTVTTTTSWLALIEWLANPCRKKRRRTVTDDTDSERRQREHLGRQVMLLDQCLGRERRDRREQVPQQQVNASLAKAVVVSSRLGSTHEPMRWLAHRRLSEPKEAYPKVVVRTEVLDHPIV